MAILSWFGSNCWPAEFFGLLWGDDTHIRPYAAIEALQGASNYEKGENIEKSFFLGGWAPLDPPLWNIKGNLWCHPLIYAKFYKKNLAQLYWVGSDALSWRREVPVTIFIKGLKIRVKNYTNPIGLTTKKICWDVAHTNFWHIGVIIHQIRSYSSNLAAYWVIWTWLWLWEACICIDTVSRGAAGPHCYVVVVALRPRL